MEFRFRAGDRRPRRPSSSSSSRPRDRRFTPRAEPFHGAAPPPPPFEWEAAARRERIIREEVERRLIEEEVQRELALARARLHGGFGPGPFVGPDGPVVPAPLVLFFGADGPFMPPPLAPVGIHWNGRPPASFRPWKGSEPRRGAGFGQRMLLGEARRKSLPPPKPKHKLELREIEPSESSEVLSSETNISGVKREADAIAATTEPTLSSERTICGVKRKVDVIAATTEPTKLQKTSQDWSCALCQVSATSEATLNGHLEGKKHKAKLAQCGAIKVIDNEKSGLQGTIGNNGAGPSDAPKKICILVDGVMHEVVQRSNYMWCERCRVRCDNNVTMAGHLRSRKHSLLNKVWTSIKAVRMDRQSKEDSVGTCEREANESSPIEIPEEDKMEGTNMASELYENGPNEIPVEIKKETTDMTEEVNEKIRIEIPVGIKKGDTDMASKVNKNGPVEIPVEIKQEGSDMAMDVNKNGIVEIPTKIEKEGKKMAREANENSSVAVTQLVPKEE